MDPEEIKNLSFGDLLQEFQHYLEDKSYTQLTLVNYYRTLRKIEPFMVAHCIAAYTPETGVHYYEDYLAKNKLGISRQKAIFTAIRRLNEFYSGMEYRVLREHEINLLPGNYEHVLDLFAAECAETGNKNVSVKSKKRSARSFIRECINFGCPDIQSLNPSYITKACLAIVSKSVLDVGRAFLKFLSIKEITRADYSTLVPHYRRPIDIPVTYCEEEIHRFEETINRTSNIGKRNFAMLLLATRLGMRSGDIAKLSLDELDFTHEEIRFIQQKNGETLHLPMVPEVKEALTDYINNVRPAVTSNTVFLRNNAPYQGITTSVLRYETSKYFRKAGIDISGKKHGPHTFRSSLASSMVNDDVPYEVVRTILGHSDPNAIKHYAKINIERLREYAIEVPKPSGSFKTFLEGGGR